MSMSRLPRWLLIVFIGLLILWAAAFVVLRRGTVQPFAAADPVDWHFSARPGMNLTHDALTSGALDATLDKLASEGITYVRFTLPWDEIEPAKGQFQWAPWDAVAAAFSRWPGLHPIVVLDRSPAWARADADKTNPLAPPHERRDYGEFAAEVARRYGRYFTYYQVWDEPNIAPHWGARPVAAQDYVGLLREAAVNLRAADPDARILAAALAPTTEPGPANLNDITYLDQLYSLGGRQWFDYPAAQPYGFDDSAGADPYPPRLNFSRVTFLRDVMVRHGDGGTALWATSFGWEGYSRENVRAAFERVRQDWTWLGPLIWTGRYPAPPATDDVMAQAGRTAAGAIGPGHYGPDAPALHYQGWRVTPSAADPSADGDTLEFIVNGSNLALDVQGGPYWAYLTVSIDGAPANRLPRDESGQSYLVLHDPASARRTVPLAEGLRWIEHRVQLTAHGGWGQWPLRGVVVTTVAPRVPPLGIGLLALGVLGLYALLAAAVRTRRRTSQSTPLAEHPERSSVASQSTPLAEHPERSSVAAESKGAERLLPQRERRILRLRSGNDSAAPLRMLRHVAIWPLAIALWALYLLSGKGTVNLVILALLGVLFLIRPQLAPPLIAAALPWWQRTQPVLRWQFGLFEALAWLGLLAWAARIAWAWLTGPRAAAASIPAAKGAAGRLPVWIDISIIALFASGLLATLFAAEQGVAWREFRIVFLFGLVLYLLVTRGSGGSVRLRAVLLVGGLLASATIASVAGLWQFVTGQGRVNVEGVGRIAAFYGSPNNLALILDRAVPLAAAFALFSGSSHPTLGARRTRSSRLAFGIVTGILLAAAVATFSKGAYLLGLPVGLAVVLLGGAWRSGKRWPLWALLALIVVGGAVLAVLFQTPRFAGLFNFEGGTSFFRLKLWRGALNMALDNPLLGVGPDNFLYAYRSHYVLPSAWQELNLSHPHNLLLDLWTRLGLIGVVAGLFALVTAFVSGWRLVRGGERGSGRGLDAVWPLNLGLLAGLAAAVAHGLIDNSLFLPDLMGWFVAALAVFWLYLREWNTESVQSGSPTNPTNRGLG